MRRGFEALRTGGLRLHQPRPLFARGLSGGLFAPPALVFINKWQGAIT